METPITRTQPASAGTLASLPWRTQGSVGFGWLRDAIAALRARLGTPPAMRRRSAERDALCGLTPHVLRDIGVSPSLMADALACARDDYPMDYDRMRY